MYINFLYFLFYQIDTKLHIDKIQFYVIMISYIKKTIFLLKLN